jgi:hypothetical protein
MIGRGVATALVVLLADFVSPQAAVAQIATTSTGPQFEVGAKVGVSRVVGSQHEAVLNPGVDLAIWLPSGLGISIGVEYSQETTPPPRLLKQRVTTIPVLADVMYRMMGDRTRLYIGVGGGLYPIRTTTIGTSPINIAPIEPVTGLGAHGLVGLETPLLRRANLVFETRFGFVRVAPDYGFRYSYGVVTALAGVRFR